MAYTVIRTDSLSGTDQRADLFSVRLCDAEGKHIAVENGVIAKLGSLEEGEREVYTATLAQAGDDLDECVLVAGVEVMYDERLRNLEDFINEAGKATRGYAFRNRNFYALTKEGFVDGVVPEVGGEVGIGKDGKHDAAATGVGVCKAIEIAGRYTYYVIQVKK